MIIQEINLLFFGIVILFYFTSKNQIGEVIKL